MIFFPVVIARLQQLFVIARPQAVAIHAWTAALRSQ